MSLINQIAISNCSQERKDQANRIITARNRSVVMNWHQGQRLEIEHKSGRLVNSPAPWLALRVKCLEEVRAIS